MTGLLLTRFAALRGNSGLQYVGGKAVTFAGGTSIGIVSLTDLTGGLASEPAAGDYVVVGYAISTQNRTPVLTITGNSAGAYDLLAGPVVGDASFDTRLYVRGKRMGATPDTTITRSATGNSSDNGGIAVHVWRGVDPTTPMDVTRTTASGTPARPDPPAITPVTAGAMIVTIGAGVSDSAWNTPSYLSGFLQSNFAGSTWISIGVGSVAWTSGAYDPAAWTGGWGGATYAAVTLALRPES